jgi:hypothetical protein
MADTTAAKLPSPTITANKIEDQDAVEDMVWNITNEIMQFADELEANEPLQAKQTFANMKARFEAVEAYLNTIGGTDEVQS